MSYYDDSSLFVAPNGYKASVLFAQKPMDANGQLAFTRSNDTATRVASNGLIEKVRTNLLVQSNTFSNAAWTKTRSSIVADSVANPIDGTVNASTLLDTTDNNTHLTFQTFTATANPYTFSVYAKAAGVNWIQMRFDNGSALQFVYFNLSTGSIGSATAASGKITSVGNGWYRCSITATATAASFFSVVHLAEANNDNSFAGTGTNGVYLYAAQTELGDIATDPILTTTAAVSVGPVANVPRIDYLGGGCGKLLLEPQRTNLVTFSEQFDNAAWIKNAALVTANDTTSPDGYANADKLIESSSTNGHFLIQSPTLTAAPYTFSVFAKAGERNWFLFRQHTLGLNASFNLATGTLGTIQSGLTASIQDYGNGWYRCSVTFTGTAAANNLRLYVTTADNNTSSYAGDGTSGLYLYGAQCELGSYATSYIPTLGAAVTRGADACSKTGISSLIGQTQGTLFVEFVSGADDATNHIMSLSDGTTNNRVSLVKNTSDDLRAFVASGGASQASILWPNYAPNTNIKAAISYKANEIRFYVNGENAGSDLIALVPASLTQVEFETSGSPFAYPVKQLIVFPTALTPAQLAELTTL